MSKQDSGGKKAQQQQRSSKLLWLLGQPHLNDYLDFVAYKVVGGRALDPRDLAEQWRAANDLYAKLERSEAGLADRVECLPIEPDLEPLADDVRANSWFKSAFDNLPYSFVRVELDKLVVSQTHVERSFTDRIADELGSKPSPADLFRFCLPIERPMPAVRMQRLSGDRFLFSSPSTDFRSHTPRLLKPEEMALLTSSGPIAAMVGLPIGFGSNFLSAIRSDSRILLQNGYHRAFALRSAGFTHAYCVVEDVTRKDELKLTVDSDVAEDPEFYFAARRPPLLKDFFDPRLVAVLDMMPMENLIEVEIRVRSSTATDWTHR